MARVSTYLNFPRNTEQVFQFYRSVFGGDFNGPIHRFADMPPDPSQPPMAEADKNLVMHVELPIIGGHSLMGTDAPESMGFTVKPGNNIYISLEPDSRAEADRLFKALSANGKVEMPLQDMFWGAYFGSFTDQFGIRWMINCPNKP
jgi:PhnB protein